MWAEVSNERGQRLSIRIKTPEAYNLTATASLLIAGKILRGQFATGFQTPAKMYGEKLVFEIEGVKEI